MTTATVQERKATGEPGTTAPPVPGSLEDTGLGPDVVSGLLLRTLYRAGTATGADLEREVRLPFPILDDELLDLQRRRLVEVRGTRGVGRRGYSFALTTEGRERSRELLATEPYVGPAPVPLEAYRQRVLAQDTREVRVGRARVRAGLDGLVLSEELLDLLGPAVNSGRALFLHGEAGNGKSALAGAIASLLGGSIWVPYAVQVQGQTIALFDPLHHEPDTDPGADGNEEAWLRPARRHDPRWARIRRPAITVGGELTLDDLEFRFDDRRGAYQAPPQMKANGGLLIIDDFGRQRVRPRDLLNRWMVPLEQRVDYLSLPTGPKVPVPFRCLLVFSTNLEPRDLMEEAFLRRIPYKIHVGDPTVDQYREIFRRCCRERGVPFSEEAVDAIWAEYHVGRGIAPRGCHPRDLVQHVCDLAQYLEVEPRLSREMLGLACRAYFLNSGSGSSDSAGTRRTADPHPNPDTDAGGSR